MGLLGLHSYSSHLTAGGELSWPLSCYSALFTSSLRPSWGGGPLLPLLTFQEAVSELFSFLWPVSNTVVSWRKSVPNECLVCLLPPEAQCFFGNLTFPFEEPTCPTLVKNGVWGEGGLMLPLCFFLASREYDLFI